MVLEQIANLSVVNSACRFDSYTLRLQNERGVKVMKGVHAVDKDKFIEAYNKWASGNDNKSNGNSRHELSDISQIRRYINYRRKIS